MKLACGEETREAEARRSGSERWAPLRVAEKALQRVEKLRGSKTEGTRRL